MTRPNLSVAFPRSVSLLTRSLFKEEPLHVKEGALPADIFGSAFYIGPAGCVADRPLPETDLIQPSQDGTPLFNGDPLVYRIDFHRQAVTLTSNIPKTPCYYTDEATFSHPKYQGLGYANYGLARLSFSLGFRNEVNTAFQPMRFKEEDGFRLLITWDAGRPYEIDPLTLEVSTPVGGNQEWKEQIDLPLPFGIVTTTAHTAFDPNSGKAIPGAELFTVNYGKSIGTALRPIFTNEAGEELSEPSEVILAEFRRLLDGLDSRIGVLVQAMRALIAIEDSLLALSPPLLRDAMAELRRQVNRRVSGVIRTLRAFSPALEQRLPTPLAIPERRSYRRLVTALISLLEELADEDFETLRGYLEEIVRLLGVARALLDAAREMKDFVDLIVWDGENELRKWSVLIEEEGHLVPPRIYQSMHQIAVTEDYVILMDTVFKLGSEQLLTSPAPGFPRLERILREFLDFRQSDDTVIYIVSRQDLTSDNEHAVARKVVIPRSAAHFLANHDNSGGRIILHMAHNNGWDPSEWTRPYDRFPYTDFPRTLGMSTSGTDINMLGRYVVDAETGSLLSSTLTSDADHTWMTAIYAYAMVDGISPVKQLRSIYWISWGCHSDLLSEYIADLYQDYSHRELPLAQVIALTRDGVPVNLVRLDSEQMRIVDHYQFPPGCFGNSPQYIPRRDCESDDTKGYLMCVVHSSDEPTRSEFWLFDAAHLHRGPICKLSHPRLAIGMTIHTTWLPSVNNRRARYNIPPETDYQARISKAPEETRELIRELFRNHVYPHFPASETPSTLAP